MIRTVTDYFAFVVHDNAVVHDGVCRLPRNVREAFASPDYDLWRVAMKREFHSLVEVNHSWVNDNSVSTPKLLSSK